MKYQSFSKSKRPHQNLVVWQEGIKFVKDIYLDYISNHEFEQFNEKANRISALLAGLIKKKQMNN